MTDTEQPAVAPTVSTIVVADSLERGERYAATLAGRAVIIDASRKPDTATVRQLAIVHRDAQLRMVGPPTDHTQAIHDAWLAGVAERSNTTEPRRGLFGEPRPAQPRPKKRRPLFPGRAASDPDAIDPPPLDESEADFQIRVIRLAHAHGWRVAHFRPARVADRADGRHRYVTAVAADGKGFPDLVLTKPNRLPIFAELKSAKGTLSDDQAEWRDALLPDLWRLWRPADWAAIELALAA